MGRPRKPYFRDSDGWWVSRFRGEYVKLARGREREAEAKAQFHTLMALSDGGRAPAARKLLARYAPDGPGPDVSAEKWRGWQSENGPYLFFSDTGGYRWLLDPLAKKRAAPTATLCGTHRATLPLLKSGR